MCLAVPGKITCITSDDPFGRTGKVSFGQIVRDVNLTCVPDAKPGDYVIVHVGIAIGKLDEIEAQKVFDYLKQIDELGDIDYDNKEI
ncbi:MAG: HypC/HybG/HupF family hydrogenase formation chaperone [Chlamydiota bacterium]|nr:HypC/HybG/HupF family hydrogenase formation chaperone [Chlamydiota bacterium]